MEPLSAATRLVILASAAFLLVLIYLLQPILMPFLVGIGIAYLGDPVVDRLEKYVGRTGGVVVFFVLMLLLILAALLLLIPMLVREISTLIQSVPIFIQWLQETTSPFLIENFGVDPFDINLTSLKAQMAGNWTEVGGIAQQFIREATASSVAMMLALANIALIPVVSFYLMRDWDELVGYIREMLPRDIESTIVKLVVECDEVLGAFLRG